MPRETCITIENAYINKMLPIITSYYTIDTPYYDVAHTYLMPSINRFQLRSDIRGVQSLGSWQSNTSYKATFILQMLEKHQEDIVFLDADAEIREYPDLLGNIPAEFKVAFHFLDKTKWYNRQLSEPLELLSGTAFFRYCPEVLALVKIWKENCNRQPGVWEQKILQKTLEESTIEAFHLPLEYCYIATLPNGNPPHVSVSRPVIIHNQVSRQLRGKV
jgi:hypothetical protein